MDPLESRVTELEIKLSYTEDLVDVLNGTIFRQQEQLAALQRHLADLQRQVQAIPAQAAGSLRDELPPHY